MTVHSSVRAGLVGLSLLALAACNDSAGEAAAPAAAPPPSQVGVVTVQPEPIAVVSELPGRIAPTRIAEVRPRVGGIIIERIFEQGTDVEAGQPLFRIDPAVFEVEVRSAQAAVQRAEAVLLQASQDAQRNRALVENRTISQASFDAAIALQRQAEADVASAQASLAGAQINLDYTTVRAPIAGRVGRALVTEGALVSQTATEALATIQQLDPVYADIQQPVTELQRLRNAVRSGALAQIEPDVAQVRLILDDGSDYGEPGRLLFSEATVDPTSGQVTLRAEFPNTDGSLLPGMYVRVAIEEGVQGEALAVPNQAIQRDTAGRAQLFLVSDENVVEVAQVTISRVIGNRSVVSQGLNPGARVIADGLLKTGPGATVEPVEWTPVGEGATLPTEEAGGPGEVGVGTDNPSPSTDQNEVGGEAGAGEAAAPQAGATDSPTAAGTPTPTPSPRTTASTE